MNIQMDSLRNHFLIAMPALHDSYFGETLTYICEHNSEGAMGIVVNKPLGLTVSEMLEHLELDGATAERGSEPVLAGGPVQEDRGFVLHNNEGHWQHSIPVTDEITLTTSRDVLAALAENTGPRFSLIALGYAGWGAGQLEDELASNAWLSSPASSDILFRTPLCERLHCAARSIGVDYGLLPSDSGHA